MKVLQVCAYAAPYEGNFIKSLKALQNKLSGYSVETVYAFPESAKNIQWCEELSKTNKVYFLPLSKASVRLSTRRILKRIYKENPDIGIIHSHFELYDIPVVLTAPKSVKVFWHLHDAIQIYTDIKNRLIHKVQYGLLHKKAKLLSVSEKHKDYVLGLGFPKENAFFLPNGLDLERINKVQTDVNERKYDFLIFGWEFERKGVDLCIKAFKKLNETARVGIVATKEIEERIISEYGEIPGLEVIELTKDINGLYAKTKCFLHISRAEGLSYALLEAVYAGLPVICSDIKENLFAEKFQSVTMVKNEDIDAIADAMKAQLAKPECEEEAVDSAREIIEKDYSVTSWVDNVLEHYYAKKANICIINGDMSKGGGTERITKMLSDVLVKNSAYKIWVLNLHNESGKCFFPLDEKVNFSLLGGKDVLSKICNLRKFVKENHIDIIINVDVMIGIFTWPVSLMCPRLKTISWEMFNIRNDIGSRHTKLVRSFSLRRSAYYICQTKGDMEAFKNEMKVKCPIKYIYNPCVFDENYTNYDKASKTIVSAGHFFYAKGFDLTVEVAARVFAKHPDWKWELYGDGTLKDEIYKSAEEKGLTDNLLFMGRTNEIEEVYKKAAMYVLTSRTEGFGLVLTEAKSLNLPTVSFDIDFGPREIIENGKSGYLIKAFDVDKMADCICELIENSEKRISFAEHARDNLNKFSFENFAKEWYEIIENIAE